MDIFDKNDNDTYYQDDQEVYDHYDTLNNTYSP